MIDKDRDSTRNFKLSADLMRERHGSNLPKLDYRRLMLGKLNFAKKDAQDSLKKRAKNIPGGKYENLLIYLKERSGKDIDAAELDRRMRTFFEDMITRVTQSPEKYDGDTTMDGRALMDYLSGMPAVGELPEGNDIAS